ADDDHAVEPDRSMFAIFWELVKGGVVCAEPPAENWAYMIDQASSLENRIRAVLHSIDSLQVSLAKALIVDAEALRQHQDRQEIVPANRVLLDAFLTDVRPIVRMARLEQGLAPDPVIAYEQSGYQQRIEQERG
ncbi:MAG: rhamnose isomerase, partial [Planctomycetota bacterium]